MPTADVNFNGSGNNTVIDASAAGLNLPIQQRIHIINFTLSVGGATDLQIKDSAGVSLGHFTFAAATVAPFTNAGTVDNPACNPATNQASIIINSTNSVKVMGVIEYAIRGKP